LNLDYKYYVVKGRRMDDKKAKKIIIETRLWAFAAWTMPFAALAALFLFEVVGWDDLYKQSIVASGVLFFTISVFWWWWAIAKVSQLAKMFIDTREKFYDIKANIQEIKKDNNDKKH